MRVLYVDIDSLRPDHLGCYGYDRPTSPTIDALAARGVRFEECFASDTPCLPSRTAMLSGRHGTKSGVVTHYGAGQFYEEPGEGHAPDPARPASFRYLSEAGVHTTTVTSFSKRHLADHFTASFRESIQPTPQVGLEDAEDVTGSATTWLDDHAAEDDWLLHVNYWDVHHPYENVAEAREQVEGPVTAGPGAEQLAALSEMAGTRCATQWGNPREYDGEAFAHEAYEEWPIPERFTDRADVEHVLEGYDAAIRKVDGHVERLLAELERHGVREETAVVVTADHGEAFGEHGLFAEHGFAHPACQRVPLVVDWPGVTDDAAGPVTEKVYQFDLVATLADLFGADQPAGWDAEPFTAALRGESFEGREALVCSQGIFTFGRAVYEGEWAFVRLLHPGVFSVPGLYNDPDLDDRGTELLYHRERDPYGLTDRADEHPEVADRLRARLDGFVSDALGTVDAAGRDPLAEMAAESGPFLYVDPAELADLLERQGRPVPDAVRDARSWVPSKGRTGDGTAARF